MKSTLLTIIISFIILLSCSQSNLDNQYRKSGPKNIEITPAPYNVTQIKVRKPSTQPSESINVVDDMDIDPNTKDFIKKVYNDSPEESYIDVYISHGTSPGIEQKEGEDIKITSKKDFTSHGVPDYGANQAATKDQGVEIDKDKASAGQSKGSGILEDCWMKVKTWSSWILWGSGISALITIILCIIPSTRIIGFFIVRLVASVIPVIGSIVERITAQFSWKNPLDQVISGGQEFKETLKKDNYIGLNERQKNQIVDMFNSIQKNNQDKSSQKTVVDIKKSKI